MRHRLEDLGRCLVLVEKLRDHDLLNDVYWRRAKDACQWFDSQVPEKKDEVIHEIAYGIEQIKTELSDIVSILRATDYLSEMGRREHETKF